MARYLSGGLLALMPLFARAAEVEAPPPVDAGPWAMIIFGLVFFGMIGGFGVFIWVKERARKAKESQS